MKKLLLAIPLLLVMLLAGLAALAGLTPAFILHGPGVGSGIGSKLLCSAEYVMGNSREQAFNDLVQYSPILNELTISYEEEQRSVRTSLFGLAEKTATYIPGLGCAVDYDSHPMREQIRVQTTETSTAPWPAGNSVQSIRAPIQAALQDMIVEDNRNGLNTRALLVVHRGEVVAEAYAQEAGPETPLLGWSMAKSLTAIMLGNLEMRGLVDTEAQAGFSRWQNDERNAIRIHDLLTMTDGLDFSEEYNPGDDATVMLFTEPSMSDYVLERPLLHEPGTVFNYSSGTANLLGRLHQEILGGPQAAYDDFMNAIYKPMAFQNAVFEMDASGVFASSSYFYASARDWARMGQLMLNGGVINGQRLVTSDWVRRASSPNNSGNDRAYGYQWWLNRGNDQLRLVDLPADSYYANGNRQQLVMVIPSAEAVIVRLGWTSGAYPVNANFSRILQLLE
jgi:CubicO group peptidase (beta-lactamase class C family)